jgi:negative regulator of replication initiation
MSQHNIRVTMLVDGDEYIGLQTMSDEDGLSDSAFMRRLLKMEARRRAMARVSAQHAAEQTAEPAQLVRTTTRAAA